MASPIERLRQREQRALPAPGEQPPEPGLPQYTGNGLLAAAEGKRAAAGFATSGLTLEKLKRCKEILDRAEVPTEGRMMA